MKRFASIEGLRGYLALWVVLTHAIELGGVDFRASPIIGLAHRGDEAVRVFIILSGFVITHLIVTKPEPYGLYIARRALRIFPVFAVACVAGYFLAPSLADYVQHVPWRHAAYLSDGLRMPLVWYEQVRTNLWPHLLAHLAMLHGAIPNEVLPQASRTFDAPGWSISLEWQFYLVAPLVLLCLRRVWSAIVLIVVFQVLASLAARGALGSYDHLSSLAIGAKYFALGIASRLAFDLLQRQKASVLLAAAAAVYAAVSFANGRPSLLIWAAFYSFLLWGRGSPVAGRLFGVVFENRLTLFLGQISYSVYIAHFLVLTAVCSTALRLDPGLTRPQLALVALAGAVASVMASVVLHYLVERPGISLGRRLEAVWPRLAGAPDAPQVALAAEPDAKA